MEAKKGGSRAEEIATLDLQTFASKPAFEVVHTWKQSFLNQQQRRSCLVWYERLLRKMVFEKHRKRKRLPRSY